MTKKITVTEIEQIQNEWGEGIVKIGKDYVEKKDYRKTAENHVRKFYGYDEGTVLFKPTKVKRFQFRKTFNSALSYFIGGNPDFPNDRGFALNPWKKVEFENAGFLINEHTGISMGNYFFTDMEDKKTKVEYTLGFYRSKTGELKINLHHSSLPFKN